MAEMFLGAIDSVTNGQKEACTAYGYSAAQTYRDVIIPQAFVYMLPLLGNQLVFLKKNSALASIITVMEITGAARRVMSETLAPFDVFISAGIVYLIANALLTYPIGFAERRARTRETRVSGRYAKA